MTDTVQAQPVPVEGKWWPYCNQTISGGCLAEKLDQGSQLGAENADKRREEGRASDDPEVIRQAQEEAAVILQDANRLKAESDAVVLCDHCPRRRR